MRIYGSWHFSFSQQFFSSCWITNRCGVKHYPRPNKLVTGWTQHSRKGFDYKSLVTHVKLSKLKKFQSNELKDPWMLIFNHFKTRFNNYLNHFQYTVRKKRLSLSLGPLTTKKATVIFILKMSNSNFNNFSRKVLFFMFWV